MAFLKQAFRKAGRQDLLTLSVLATCFLAELAFTLKTGSTLKGHPL